MTSTTLARGFLFGNAGFSIVTGATLLFGTLGVADMLFAAHADWQPPVLRFLAVGLFLFASGLIFLATNRYITATQVLVITWMDIGWVLASLLLLVLKPQMFTPLGGVIVAAVAAIVAMFAVGQYTGACRIVAPASQVAVRGRDGRLVATARRAVEAPADAVWAVMTDHPGYADVAANLSKVEVLSGAGIGMERRCYGTKGENWRETCDLYEEGEAFGFRVHTEAEDYPYPIKNLSGRWSVTPARTGFGSEFSIEISADPKGGLLRRALFSTMAKRQFGSVLTDLAEAWADRMENKIIAPA